jgi:ABC-type Fe3+-hydroxamate transport system substrate-binding protein
MAVLTDDTGALVDVPGDVRRVVSLVPSLTESLAATSRDLLVGVTDWCTHPAGLEVSRVGGTKNPDVDAIVALAPDLVVANEEENRAPDLQSLRDKGIAVWVTDVRDVAGSFGSLARMIAACRLPRPRWLDEAEAAWRDVGEVEPGRRVRAVVPIWRRPWMALGRDTFAGDVLRRLGVDNVLDGSPDRYPRFDPTDLPAVDLVVLPDEPYRFAADDGPEAFPGLPSALVDGRSLTWYGPSMVQAPGRLLGELRAAR